MLCSLSPVCLCGGGVAFKCRLTLYCTSHTPFSKCLLLLAPSLVRLCVPGAAHPAQIGSMHRRDRWVFIASAGVCEVARHK